MAVGAVECPGQDSEQVFCLLIVFGSGFRRAAGGEGAGWRERLRSGGAGSAGKEDDGGPVAGVFSSPLCSYVSVNGFPPREVAAAPRKTSWRGAR